MTERTTAYTDGACSGNPGPGGWAWVVPGGAFGSGYEPDTTNQRMELQAALEAIRAIEGPVEIVSDSTYLVNCFRDGWWEGWIKRGWTNSAKKPVANRDIWEPLIMLYGERDLTFRWVKGHDGDEWNDVADRLAVEAVGARAGRTGTETPTDLGSADEVRAKAKEATSTNASGSETGRMDPPPGHRLVVVGHRPPAIGGYDPNPTADHIRRQLTEILTAKAEMHDDLLVLTGLRLGAEQLGAEAAAEAGVPYAAVLPYPNPEVVWPPEAQRRYAQLLEGAAHRQTLQTKSPDGRQQAGAAMSRRDAWLARNASEAIVVWDRKDADVGRFVRSLEDHLADDVWIVEPL